MEISKTNLSVNLPTSPTDSARHPGIYSKLGLISLVLLSRVASATNTATQPPSLRGVPQAVINNPGINGPSHQEIELVTKLPHISLSTMTSSHDEALPTVSETSQIRELNASPLNEMHRYINGDLFDQLAPESLLNEARSYLAANPLPNAAENLTEFKAKLFAFLKNEHCKRSPVVSAFADWRAENGRGGTKGAGTGLIYVNQMQGMRNDLIGFIGDQAHVPTWTQFSSNLVDKIPAPTGATRNPLPDSVYDVTLPSYLTVEGGDDILNFDGRDITALGDFVNPDEIGRAVGINVQGRALTKFGGTLRNDDAPADAIFYIIQQGILLDPLNDFLETPTGQAYLSTEEGQDWFDSKDQLTGLATAAPTSAPSTSVSQAPTSSPTSSPTESPTVSPTEEPTPKPMTLSPTNGPTERPTNRPTTSPVTNPPSSESPTSEPTTYPTMNPTETVTTSPSAAPTTAAPSTDDPGETSNASKTIIAVVVALGAAACLGGTGWYLWNRHNESEAEAEDNQTANNNNNRPNEQV